MKEIAQLAVQVDTAEAIKDLDAFVEAADRATEALKRLQSVMRAGIVQAPTVKLASGGRAR